MESAGDFVGAEDGEQAIDAEEEAAPSTRASQTPAPASRPRTQIKYDDYIKIHNMLLRRVSDDASAAEDGVEEEDLLMWYLEQKQEELLEQEDVERERELAKKVVKRMVKVRLSSLLN